MNKIFHIQIHIYQPKIDNEDKTRHHSTQDNNNHNFNINWSRSFTHFVCSSQETESSFSSELFMLNLKSNISFHFNFIVKHEIQLTGVINSRQILKDGRNLMANHSDLMANHHVNIPKWYTRNHEWKHTFSQVNWIESATKDQTSNNINKLDWKNGSLHFAALAIFRRFIGWMHIKPNQLPMKCFQWLHFVAKCSQEKSYRR